MTCSFCGTKATCARCVRLADVRTIADALDLLPTSPTGSPAAVLRRHAIGALGRLMVERSALVARHNREMRDEAQETARAARDSYYDGRQSMREE